MKGKAITALLGIEDNLTEAVSLITGAVIETCGDPGTAATLLEAVNTAHKAITDGLTEAGVI